MSDDIAAAEARAEQARARLNATVGTLQTQLAPAQIGKAALAEIRGGGGRAARASVDVAKRHPGVVAGAVGLISLVLGRKRIATRLGRGPRT